MATVKQPGKRAERAQRTRSRIIDAARELFVERGYGTTNLQDIADRAGVAVQTIYYVFGNKRTLFKDVVDTTIAGDTEPVSTVDRAWFRDACAAPTAAGQLHAHVHGTRKILERVAPITPLIAAATATDPEIAAQWPSQQDPRYAVHHAAAEALVAKPDARSGLTATKVADLLFGLLSPQLYLLLVHDRGWSPEDWEQWVHTALNDQLCAPNGGAG